MAGKLFFLFLLIPFIGFSQKEPRQLLRGRAVADSLQVDNISVKNITSNIGAVTDTKGNFTIYARPTDTLVFSGISFRNAMLVLKKEHFTEARLIIRLDVNVTVLDEVIISPLTGNLEKDSRKAKTKNVVPFNSGSIVRDTTYQFKYSQNINTALPQNESQLQGVDFVKIYKKIFRPKKKKKEEPKQYAQRNFAEVAQELYTHYFFTETLKIPHDEIGLFLTYCDNGEQTRQLLDPAKEFELTDYLIDKSYEYLKLKN